MESLPPEVQQKIFSELRKMDLLSMALTNSIFHDACVTLLYRKIQEIQLFGWDANAHEPSIKCLQTLASPGSKPKAVRHFAVRGIPWLQEDTMRVLSQGLVNMVGLLSLDLDMGALPETILFPGSRCASLSFLPRLTAVSLHDHSRAVTLVTGRPVEYLRLRASVESVGLPGLLIGLRSMPLRNLQISISVINLSSAAATLANISYDIPYLKSLGITFTFPTPFWTNNLRDAIEQICDPLPGFSELKEFGLALIPEPRATRNDSSQVSNSTASIDLIHLRLSQLRLIEVQWEAREIRNGILRSLGNRHSLMRRVWRYSHAK